MQKEILIKYGERKHLQDIIDGKLRFSPSKTYIDMEKQLHNKGQGDSAEGQIIMRGGKAQLISKIDSSVVYEFKMNTLNLSFEDVNNMPIFCMSSYNKNYVSEKMYFQLPREKISGIKHDFPKATHALIVLDPLEFKIEAERAGGHKIIGDKVHYFDYLLNNYSMYAYITTGDENAKIGSRYWEYKNRYRYLFCKDISFKNQDEYRFIVLDQLSVEPVTYDFKYNGGYMLVDIDELENPLYVGNNVRKRKKALRI